jgi:hypothetical protein
MLDIEILLYMGGEGNQWLTYKDISKYTFTDEFLILERGTFLQGLILTHIPKEQILLMEVFK